MPPTKGAPPDESALLLINIGQLLTLRSPSGASGPRRGPELSQLGIVKDAAVLCLGGRIISVGTTQLALRDSWLKKNRKRLTEIDCAGKVVLPGFVDSHTHPAFAAPRLIDFEKRIAGATYEEISEAGGGIRSSVKHVRQIGLSPLADMILGRLREMAACGTTTVEAKSGYGLTLAAETKSLQAICDAAMRWRGTVVPTMLGAHVVPQEFEGQPQAYVDVICRKMIPQTAKLKLARFVDVFCDRGAFSATQTEQIFSCAEKYGLRVRAHVGQLSETRLPSLLRFGPASLDHLDHVNDDDISQFAKSNTVATFVPGANYFLGLTEYPPARKLIDAGAAVALATDYNPGSSPTCSMPFVLSLACTHMKMSPAESIAASTINGAAALCLAHRKGSLEAGKDADLAIFDVKDYREIPYWVASKHCCMTILNGAIAA